MISWQIGKQALSVHLLRQEAYHELFMSRALCGIKLLALKVRNSGFVQAGQVALLHRNNLLITPAQTEPPVRTLRATIPENESH